MYRILHEFERFSRPLLHLILVGLVIMLFFFVLSYIESGDEDDDDSVTITYNCTYTLNNRERASLDAIHECMNLRRNSVSTR
jgi:hypothetical protein